MAKYYVGQKLWLDHRIYGLRAHGRSCTVKKVGRKWVTLDCNSRFDAKCDLPVMVQGSDRRVFESQEHAIRYRRVRDNWTSFVAYLIRTPMPADMTTGKIIDAARLLGIDVEIVSSKESNDG